MKQGRGRRFKSCRGRRTTDQLEVAGLFVSVGGSALLRFRQDAKAGALREFEQSERRAPRGGVAEIFRQENYL